MRPGHPSSFAETFSGPPPGEAGAYFTPAHSDVSLGLVAPDSDSVLGGHSLHKPFLPLRLIAKGASILAR